MSMPKTLGRMPVEQEILGLQVETKPLPFEAARAMLPDVVRFLTKAGALIAEIANSGVSGLEDVKKLLAFLPRLDPETTGFLMDMLNKHHKQLLASTIVVMQHPVNGELENFELVKSDRRTMVFDEHPDAFVPICIFAGRVTFERFFPGRGQQEGPPAAAES